MSNIKGTIKEYFCGNEISNLDPEGKEVSWAVKLQKEIEVIVAPSKEELHNVMKLESQIIYLRNEVRSGSLNNSEIIQYGSKLRDLKDELDIKKAKVREKSKLISRTKSLRDTARKASLYYESNEQYEKRDDPGEKACRIWQWWKIVFNKNAFNELITLAERPGQSC